MSTARATLQNYLQLSLAILGQFDDSNDISEPQYSSHGNNLGHFTTTSTNLASSSHHDALHTALLQRRLPAPSALLTGAGSNNFEGAVLSGVTARKLSSNTSLFPVGPTSMDSEKKSLQPEQGGNSLEDAMVSSAVHRRVLALRQVAREKKIMEQSILLNQELTRRKSLLDLVCPRGAAADQAVEACSNNSMMTLKTRSPHAAMPMTVVAGHRGDLPPSSILQMMAMQDSQRQLSCASSMILAHHQHKAQDTTARRTARTEDVHAPSRLLEDKAEAPRRTLEALGQLLRTKGDQYVDVMPLLSTMSIVEEDIKKARGGVTEHFPARLHRMLSESEENGLSDVIAFFPHGRAFSIIKSERFVSEILPKYFKQSRLGSFQRQLNLYGFKRIGSGPDEGGYYHELFLKGQPALCHFMRRAGVSASAKGGDRRRNQDTFDSEPNFYAMTDPCASRAIQ